MRIAVSSPCTNCGKLLDAAGVPGSETPTPVEGDVTICLYCRHLMIFGLGLLLRNPTDAEMVEIGGDPRLLEVMEFSLAFSKWKENQ